MSNLPQKLLNRANNSIEEKKNHHRSLEATHDKNQVNLEEKKGFNMQVAQQEERKSRRSSALEEKKARKKAIEKQNIEESK